jgi:hypothetical protein
MTAALRMPGGFKTDGRGDSQSRGGSVRIQALAIFAIGAASIVPAAAQTYDPAYPVCLQAYGPSGNGIDCSYTSLPQCNATASGLSAQCLINPYFVRAQGPAGYRRHR